MSEAERGEAMVVVTRTSYRVCFLGDHPCSSLNKSIVLTVQMTAHTPPFISSTGHYASMGQTGGMLKKGMKKDHARQLSTVTRYHKLIPRYSLFECLFYY
jgi:hypothetical protein